MNINNNLENNILQDFQLKKLINMLKRKGKYLLYHSENVAFYSKLLGEKLGLSNKDLQILEISGLFHDIGKNLMPNYILNKDGVLTSEEFELIKLHPIIGEFILSNYVCDEITRVVRSHHERLDGTGYPDGLKEEQIPYFSKIISIADAFDAMTTKRPYNCVKNLEEALQELDISSKKIEKDNKIISQQFDPNLVAIFIELMKEKDSYLEFVRRINLQESSNQDKCLIKDKFKQ